jgi:LPPG:FO 2-phospho-L-lactate transferase
MALASDARRARGDPPLDLAVVVNTGDDLELHGLHVSPDLDTVMYTLAGVANEETGWGLRDETWSAAEMLGRYGAETWFSLGDRDLATHLVRTEALRHGERLTTVTERLASSLGVTARILPMTDDPVRTELLGDDGWLEFQEYFVHRRFEPPISAIRYRGAEQARPTQQVVEAIGSADLIVLAPSNPYLSIGAILAVPGIADAIARADAPVAAVSPIVGGAALRGPADRLMTSLGGTASAAGVATHYHDRHPGLVDVLVLDTLDAPEAQAVEALAMEPLVTETVMGDRDDRRTLAETILTRFAR